MLCAPPPPVDTNEADAGPERAGRDQLRLVIFDCDGVLIDSEGLCNRVVADELTASGWPMSADDSHRLFLGLTFPDTKLLAERHLKRSLGADWVDRVIARVTEVMAKQATAIPGARAALEATTALGLPWRIASNSSHQEMQAKFQSAGLADLVAGRLHSAYDVIARGGTGKPAPDLFLEAAAAQAVHPAACVVIEDSLAGVKAARAAGMACLAFCPDGDGVPLRAAGASLFSSMHALPGLLRRMQEKTI